MIIPSWFLYVSGFSLLILGGLQIYTRPYEPGDSFVHRFVNAGTLWSLICLAVGAALLAMALGYWRGPLPPPRAATTLATSSACPSA